MAKNLPTYRKLTVTSSPDPNNVGAYDIPRYLPDVKLMETAVKSALKDKEFFYMGERRVDPVTHEEKIDIYVHEDRGDVSKASLDKFSTSFKGSNNAKYTITESQLSAEEQKAVAKEELARSKADGETTRFNRGSLLKIIGAITVLTNLVRRILSSVLTFSQQTARDMITAGNLGMSYESVRKYRHIETIHNLSEGTITDSIADIQKAFGNITSLDEKALESLALIMGGKIQEMVEMGLGASNPEKILEAIIDAFNEKANAGYNSLGQYVGEAQARRELYSYLNKIFPKIADIFGTMQEEQHNINSIFRDQASTWKSWTNIIPTKRSEHVPAEYNIPASVSQEWGVVQSIYKQLLEGIYVTLAPDLMALLRRIADFRFGISEAENQERNKENKEANEAFLESAKVQLEMLEGGNLTEAQRQRKLALEYYVADIKKANKGNIKGNIRYAVPTEDEIVVKGLKLAETQAVKSTWKQEVVYSPALRNVVDTYVDADKLSAFINAYKQNRFSEARKETENIAKGEASKRKKEREAQIASEVKRRVYEDKSSPYYLDALRRLSLFNRGDYEAVAEIEARYEAYMKNTFDKDGVSLWDKWNAFDNVYSKGSFAVEHGLAYWSNTVAKTGARALPNSDDYYKLSDYEKQQIYEDIVSKMNLDEEVYVEAYKKWWDKLNQHLLGALQGDLREASKEGTPMYDLGILQGMLGAHLEDLPQKIAEEIGDKTYIGEGAILSYTTQNGNVITHRIIFDLNNNGVPEATDVPLYSYKTNRISDVGTVVEKVVIDNGKVILTQAQGTPASKGD